VPEAEVALLMLEIVTVWSVEPVSSVTTRFPPESVTASLKVTVTLISSSILKVPSEVDEVTDEIVGTLPSTTKASLSARLLPDGMEKLDILLLAASDRVPADKAIVLTVRSELASPDWTV
jgi:hypothetical protein